MTGTGSQPTQPRCAGKGQQEILSAEGDERRQTDHAHAILRRGQKRGQQAAENHGAPRAGRDKSVNARSALRIGQDVGRQRRIEYRGREIHAGHEENQRQQQRIPAQKGKPVPRQRSQALLLRRDLAREMNRKQREECGGKVAQIGGDHQLESAE